VSSTNFILGIDGWVWYLLDYVSYNIWNVNSVKYQFVKRLSEMHDCTYLVTFRNFIYKHNIN